ncbi:MAG: glycosyltransferase family 2 protein [Planctomycetota bacterium]|nr:glycosyltransferase family 2 protein [Planctomycetota bacterium]
MTSEALIAAEVMLWSCFAIVVYSYAGYPVALLLLTRQRTVAQPPAGPFPAAPTVSVLIAAHNEEQFIVEKVRNTVASLYPQDRVQIVVASDGSSDRTVEMIQGVGYPQVRLFDYADRRGKASLLNATIPELTGEIIVLSDANTLFELDAISRLVRWFEDPTVGTVCGRLVLTDPATGQNVDSLYWRYETYLKKKEGRLGALLGANGAIYAIRRSQYVPIPNNTIVDDFVIPLLSKLHHGGRIVYDESAVAFEETPAAIGSEFRRRTRIGTGGYQSLALLWRLLHPRYGWTAFAFYSHKVLRWVAPFLLIGAFVSNITLVSLPFYRWTMVGQIVFYLTSFVGVRVQGRGLPFRLLRLAGMFTGMNAALFVGFLRWLMLPQTGTWQRTAR